MLQNKVKSGSYYLEVQELGYELNLPEVHSQNSQNTLKQFRRCALIPSMSKMLFKRTRKIVAIDGAVLRGDFGGVSLVIVGYYANNQTCILAFAIVDVENCENWQWFLSIVLKDLGAPRLIISDKLSGLYAINEWLRGINKNEQVRKHYGYAEDVETVRMSVCAVHAARNCGITDRIALGGIIRMALCGDIGFRRRYLRSFVIGDSSRCNTEGKITQQQANKLARRLPEFCFPEMGLDTCTGIVTSNQAESFNHETTKLRNLDVH